MGDNLESLARDLSYCKRWLELHKIDIGNPKINDIKKELYKDIIKKEKGLIPNYTSK